MASSSDAPGASLRSDPSSEPAASLDTILLHVLTPSEDIPGGKISFPSISLDTTISHLKSRIQNSIVAPVSPERLRLIYCGRPLLDLKATLRQVLRSQLNISNDLHPTCTLHLIISPVPGSHTAQGRTPPQSQDAPHSRHNHHHQHHPHPPIPTPSMADLATIDPARIRGRLTQLQQQVQSLQTALRQPDGQGQDPPQATAQGPEGMTTAETQAQNLLRLHQHRQLLAANAAMHALEASGVNLDPANMTSDLTSQGIGPITTRVHETVGVDGSTTRVVINESSFQLSRQATPIPGADSTENRAGTYPQTQSSFPLMPLDADLMGDAPNRSSGTVPYNSNLNLHPNFPYPDTRFMPEPNIPQGPGSLGQPPRLLQSHISHGPFTPNPWGMTTTAYLLSGPAGPHALLFAPGQGVYTTTNPISGLRSRTGYRPQNNTGIRARTSEAAGQTAPSPAGPGRAPQRPARGAVDALARANIMNGPPRPLIRNANAHNDFLRNIVTRTWTFIKFYVVILMFTEPGSYFRKACLFSAVIIAIMPSTTMLTDALARAQAQVDGLVGPPQRPTPPTVPPAASGAGNAPRATAGTSSTGAIAQGEANAGLPASNPTVAQESANRHPLRASFERVEQALGLFMASLIPGVGERHVRAREEARREAERLETERERERELEHERKATEETKGLAREDEASPSGSRDVLDTSEKPGPSIESSKQAEQAAAGN